MTFEELFDHLINSSSSRHQSAWLEFMRRYEKILENTIAWRCYNWNSKALKKQISDVIDTVKSGVLLILCRNDFRALKNFRHKDNEKKFVSYLRMIATNDTGRYLKKNFPRGVITEEELSGGENEDNLLDTLRGMDDEARWEIYEHIVAHFYTDSKRTRGNLDRDIQMFWLYLWAELDNQMIVSIPCLRGMDPHNVDVVVSRMKNILRDVWDSKAGQ
jgi:hypothetical protein